MSRTYGEMGARESLMDLLQDHEPECGQSMHWDTCMCGGEPYIEHIVDLLVVKGFRKQDI